MIFALAPFVMLISAPASEPPVFPEKFRGVWDVGPKPCEHDVSDTRIAIEERVISYWESGGEPSQMVASDDNDISVTLAMAGEEQTWTKKTRFVISRDGSEMFAEELPIAGEDYYRTTWFYHRCTNGAKIGWGHDGN